MANLRYPPKYISRYELFDIYLHSWLLEILIEEWKVEEPHRLYRGDTS